MFGIDEEAKTITVEIGVRYGNFWPFLHLKGYAIHNLASLPHITAVGACATATHGSGDTNENMGTSVTALELVTINGEVQTVGKSNHNEFN